MTAIGNNTMVLGDGRRLGYAEYGDPGGWPLLFFHGTPGSRIMARLAAAWASESGVRLIAPERPGYGLSEAQPHRRLLDWPDDVAELVDALGVEHFGVVGISGGGPYALACAWKLPTRLTAAGLVSSLGPVVPVRGQLGWRQRLLARAVRQTRWTEPVCGWLAAMARRNPHLISKGMGLLAGANDRAILARREVQDILGEGAAAAFQGGGAGWATELALFSRPWGFALEDIRTPVYLWHGEADGMVPIVMGRYLAAHLPRGRARFIPGAGHLWIFQGYEEVLEILIPRCNQKNIVPPSP